MHNAGEGTPSGRDLSSAHAASEKIQNSTQDHRMSDNMKVGHSRRFNPLQQA